MNLITRRALLAAAVAFAAAPAVVPAARAQSSTMTILVPYPPGGSTDALARLLQPALQERLKRTVVVENRVGGAAGAVGAAHVAKSPPDGSIFLIAFDAHAVMPAIIEKPPLDIETDLAPVFLFGTAPYVIAANAGTPYKTIGDVIEACRSSRAR